jgi:hypothetical protein
MATLRSGASEPRPGSTDYQVRTDRTIPVILLEPGADGGASIQRWASCGRPVVVVHRSHSLAVA